MILTLSLLIWEMIEYKVVVLPLPVGPVTISTPVGLEVMSLSIRKARSLSPSLSMRAILRWRSKIRKTKFSPCTVGWAATRKSISRP